MKSKQSDKLQRPEPLQPVMDTSECPGPIETWFWRLLGLAAVAAIVIALASCSSLGKPERQPSPVAHACSQRTPALDSGDPPSGADVTDWMAWAAWGVRSQWAIVDRDNKRAATADCLDKLAEIKP